jgi:Lon protease-like protein
MMGVPLQFDRPMPLFPLPNCVLFPGVVQPLHIFEPRYREMMEESLEDQSAIVMALLKPGWEPDYYARPAIFEVVCAGRIVAHERLADGKFNLLLHGVTRARILHEQKQGLYRVAILDPITDEELDSVSGGGTERMQRKVLQELFEKTPLKELTVAPLVATLFEEEVPLGRLVDTLAFSLVQDVMTKQRMLEELCPLNRGELLLQQLISLASKLAPELPVVGKDPQKWPPQVGVN